MTAGFMLLAVTFLALVIDSGRLYVEKRRLQRIADMAAIEAMSRDGSCATGTASTYATQNAARNGFVVGSLRKLSVSCGQASSSGGLRALVATPVGGVDTAIQVVVSDQTPASLVAGGLFGGRITLTATAVATKGVPLAALTLRSTVATVDSTQGALLNTVVGALLGGAVNVSVLGWNGLIGTQINLLDFLDQLKVDLGLNAGGYNDVLSSNVSVGQVLDTAITVLSRDGSTASTTLTALSAIKAGAIVSPVTVQLGKLLNLQTGTSYSGADLSVGLGDFVNAVVQLANGQNAAVVNVPITIPGVAGASVSVQVIEPPQLSSVGNPALAKADPLGPNKIYVRSAQVRSLISVDLPAVSGLSSVITAVSSVLSPVTTLLTNSFSLSELVSNLLCGIIGTCTGKETLIKVLPSARADINLDVGGGESYVNDYSCASGARSLSAPTKTAAATLRIGQMGTSAADAKTKVFSSHNAPVVDPIPVVQIGYVEVQQSCIIGLCYNKKYLSTGGAWVQTTQTDANNKFTIKMGLGLKTDTPVAGLSQTLVFSNPPEVGAALTDADYKSINSQSVVNSLVNTLASITLQPYYTSDSGILGALFGVVTSAVDALKTALQNAIVPLLSAVLDPLLNFLLNQLGVNLAKTEVAGQLSCGSATGVSLVR